MPVYLPKILAVYINGALIQQTLKNRMSGKRQKREKHKIGFSLFHFVD